jgi:probable F420-dependent oxidoreductase
MTSPKPRFRVGVQIQPQHCTIDELRAAWEAADALGVDSIWTWDHFFPLYGEKDGEHYEGWSLLAAMAVTTHQARFGMLVTCNSYRNPELLVDMARTVDQLSHGRLILGLGAGWFERDYREYGYDFGTAPGRLRALRDALPRIEERKAKLNPPPAGDLPILIGGGGEKVTLKLVAQHAQLWNGFGPPSQFRHKCEVLDRHCADNGRNPREIERTAAVNAADVEDEAQVQEWLDAGAEHLIVMTGAPFDLAPVERLLARARD